MMGCDIHFYVEKKSNGLWESVDTWELEDEGEEYESLDVDYHKRYYSGRNYLLFAIFADVRNYNSTIKYIEDPKGLPEDASKEVRECSERWDGDGHSHSYFTVSELIKYDWTQTFKDKTIISLEQYFRWSNWGKKTGATPKNEIAEKYRAGEKARLITELEAETLKAATIGRSDIEEKVKNLFIEVEWDEPYYRQCEGFILESMPRLWALGSPDDVRIVFWFDN